MSVAAVVVSYNVRDLLLGCLDSLEAARAAGELAEIVVIDNTSRDGSAEAVRAAFPDVRVIEAENRGYGTAANRGFGATTSEFILVLNPDTVVLPSAIAALADHLRAHPEVAIAGPRMRYPDGSEQPTRRRFPARLTPLFESTLLETWRPGNRWAREFRMLDAPDACDIPQQVDWLVGAALLVRRAAVDRVGGFDERFHLYSEEVEWCWRLRRHGWRIAWVPAAEVIHYEGASSAQDVPRRQIEFDRSRVRLARGLYGPVVAGVVRAGLLFGYLLQLVIEGPKWLLGHKRPLRAGRIALYARALSSGLREGRTR